MNSKLNKNQNWPELAEGANWSASALAKKCCVSLRTLERHFVNQTGKSPKAWLNEERVRRATELLQDDSRVKEVATRLGFTNQQHFSREFKRQKGYPPSQSRVSQIGI
jgi:transcriptional regulator GlxA family with amidase domain